MVLYYQQINQEQQIKNIFKYDRTPLLLGINWHYLNGIPVPSKTVFLVKGKSRISASFALFSQESSKETKLNQKIKIVGYKIFGQI